MTGTPRAADLPVGTIIVINRFDVYVKDEESPGSPGPWSGTGTRWAVPDEQIDPLLELGATVVRYGFGGQA